MVRKIKVVNINEIKPIETINQSEIGNVILNDEDHYISEPEVRLETSSSDEIVEPIIEKPVKVKVKANRKGDIKQIETEQNETMDPRSLQDLANAIIKNTKETNEDLKKITIDNQTEKDIAKIPCPNCSKMMSVKSLKYSHQKNCKSLKPKPEIIQSVAVIPPIPEHTPEPTIINTPVHVPTPLPIVNRVKVRNEINQQRINTLMSQAF